MSTIKCNINDFLNKKGITQRELAKKIGTTEVSISRYINCERIPKAITCIQIAKALDCKVEDLYEIGTKVECHNAEFKNHEAVFHKCIEIMEEFDTWDIIEIISFLSNNISQYRDTFPLKFDKKECAK